MNELFTTKDVANYLKINEKKVYKLIKDGKIPCTRVAGKWLFPKRLIDEWIERSVKSQQDIYIAGSNDPFLEYLVSLFLKESFPDMLIYYANIGSSKGFLSLAANKSDIAVSHLFDMRTREYNLPFIKKYLDNVPVTVINFAYRQQGFIVKKGNPYQIENITALIGKNIKFVNRNTGSGTRLLLDYILQKSDIDPSQINGYNREVNSHIEVGLEILHNNADVGIGIRYIADILGLDFIPITSERIDLIIRKDDFNLHHLQKFISLLDPIKISLYADKFQGYDFQDTGRIIYQDK